MVNVDGIKNGAKIYKRSDDEYIVVNKNGYVRRGHADWRKGRFWLMEKKLP